MYSTSTCTSSYMCVNVTNMSEDNAFFKEMKGIKMLGKNLNNFSFRIIIINTYSNYIKKMILFVK